MFSMRKLFVLGSPRSGTTWIASTISRSRFHRLLSEPEIHETLSLCDRELREPRELREARNDLEKVLDNRLMDRRSYRHGVTRFGYHRMNWLIRVLVVKMIRCNLAIDHLGAQTRSRCLFVLRCPRATIGSQVRVDFGHLPDLGILMESGGVRAFVERHGYADRELGFVESLALRWVIENVYAMEASSPTDHVRVQYEQLRDDPSLWPHLLDRLELRVPKAVLEASTLREPSATTFPSRDAYRMTDDDKVALEALLSAFRVDEFLAEFREHTAVG